VVVESRALPDRSRRHYPSQTARTASLRLCKVWIPESGGDF
jgi:hypothetical protein